VKIYTRTGDRGETGLLDSTRVSKSDARVDACGDVDELNAWLGLVRSAGVDAETEQLLIALQQDLHALGAQLADPFKKIAGRVTKTVIAEEDIGRLEEWIDRFEAELPPLRQFILAGGSPAGAALHVARTVCRRAERRIVSLGPNQIDPVLLAYMNRLSDLLFVLARVTNHRVGSLELEW